MFKSFLSFFPKVINNLSYLLWVRPKDVVNQGFMRKKADNVLLHRTGIGDLKCTIACGLGTKGERNNRK